MVRVMFRVRSVRVRVGDGLGNQELGFGLR
jgi:hypothetical protein